MTYQTWAKRALNLLGKNYLFGYNFMARTNLETLTSFVLNKAKYFHRNYIWWQIVSMLLVDVGKVELRIIHCAEVEEALRHRISWSPSPSKPQRISQFGCYPFPFWLSFGLSYGLSYFPLDFHMSNLYFSAMGNFSPFLFLSILWFLRCYIHRILLLLLFFRN